MGSIVEGLPRKHANKNLNSHGGNIAMYESSRNLKPTPDESKELRREFGVWLKQRREALGLRQRELAELLALDYYTFISQLETGRGRIPSARYADWANALQMPPREFIWTVMRYYNPEMFHVLNGEDENSTMDEHLR